MKMTLEQLKIESFATEKSLEQLFFEQTGREVRRARPTFTTRPVRSTFTSRRSSATPVVRQRPAHFISELDWQKTVQIALRTQADFAAKEEKQKEDAERMARDIAVMRAEVFPWEVN